MPFSFAEEGRPAFNRAIYAEFQDIDPQSLESAIDNLMANFKTLDGGFKHLMISIIVDGIEIKRDSIGIFLKKT